MSFMDEILIAEIEKPDINTPLRDDAFELSDEEKINKIEFHFARIMETLGLDLNDDI